MKITFLIDNKTEEPNCNAEWGLSLFLETEKHKYIFDVGASDMLMANAKALDIDLREAEVCMISHGHYDHTNGMEAFTGYNKTAPVYIHKEAIMPSYGVNEDGVIDDYSCGVNWTEEFTESIKDRIIPTEGVVKINEELTLVGNIPDSTEYEKTEGFVKYLSGKLVSDNMNHEQFLVVSEEDGIHIVSGCSHKGSIQIVLYAKELFPGKRIKSLTGGMHTYMFKDEKCVEFVNRLSELGVEKVIPMHCTGMNMIITMKEMLKENCIVAYAGGTVEL